MSDSQSCREREWYQPPHHQTKLQTTSNKQQDTSKTPVARDRAPKNERSKQRRPDMQVYVPRGRRSQPSETVEQDVHASSKCPDEHDSTRKFSQNDRSQTNSSQNKKDSHTVYSKRLASDRQSPPSSKCQSRHTGSSKVHADLAGDEPSKRSQEKCRRRRDIHKSSKSDSITTRSPGFQSQVESIPPPDCVPTIPESTLPSSDNPTVISSLTTNDIADVSNSSLTPSEMTTWKEEMEFYDSEAIGESNEIQDNFETNPVCISENQDFDYKCLDRVQKVQNDEHSTSFDSPELYVDQSNTPNIVSDTKSSSSISEDLVESSDITKEDHAYVPKADVSLPSVDVDMTPSLDIEDATDTYSSTLSNECEKQSIPPENDKESCILTVAKSCQESPENAVLSLQDPQMLCNESPVSIDNTIQCLEPEQKESCEKQSSGIIDAAIDSCEGDGKVSAFGGKDVSNSVNPEECLSDKNEALEVATAQNSNENQACTTKETVTSTNNKHMEDALESDVNIESLTTTVHEENSKLITDQNIPNKDSSSVENVSQASAEDEVDEDDEDTWDKLFDEDGEALDPTIMDQLTKAVGEVKVQRTQFDYYDYQPKDPDFDESSYAHLVEIYDFPKELLTRDLLAAFRDYKDRGFDIKWVDDSHAIGIFSSSVAAQGVLGMRNPMMKVRPISQASSQTRMKARKNCQFLEPYRERPQTTAAVARSLVTGALGLKQTVPKEKRAEERKKLQEAKEKRRQERQQKKDAWDGNIGSCAMDI